MDFTREPIIETIITPKEGCKLVVRSSKNAGQEEYFIDSLEVVTFGNALFYRSLEKPKSFLLPCSDYEVLEVREARMILKNVGIDRSIKIGGGRETPKTKEVSEEKKPEEKEEKPEVQPIQAPVEVRLEKKRDRRKQYKRRREKEEKEAVPVVESVEEEKVELPEPTENEKREDSKLTTAILSSLLAPPPTLIRETIGQYRKSELFKDAFYEISSEEGEQSTIRLEAEEIKEDFLEENQEDFFKEHGKVRELLEEDEDYLPFSNQKEEEFPPLKEEAELPERTFQPESEEQQSTEMNKE